MSPVNKVSMKSVDRVSVIDVVHTSHKTVFSCTVAIGRLSGLLVDVIMTFSGAKSTVLLKNYCIFWL